MAFIKDLMVGDFVYLKENGQIQQGKVTKLITKERISHYAFLCYICEVVEIEIKLPNGKVLTNEDFQFGTKENYNGCTIKFYPTITDCRRGWHNGRDNYYTDGKVEFDVAKRYANRFYEELEGIDFSANDVPILYYHDENSVYTRYLEVYDFHNGEEYKLRKAGSDANFYPISAWLETVMVTFNNSGYKSYFYKTYDEAFNACTPNVVFFEEQPIEPKVSNYAIYKTICDPYGGMLDDELIGSPTTLDNAIATIGKLVYNTPDREVWNDGNENFYWYVVRPMYDNGDVNMNEVLYTSERYVIK